MKKTINNNKQNGGFLKLPLDMVSQPEVATLFEEEKAPGLGLYIYINWYLAHCQGGWAPYTGRLFSSLAVAAGKHRSDVKRVIDDYGLFVVENGRFTSHWVQNNYRKGVPSLTDSRAFLYTGAQDKEIDIEKENKEKASVRVSDDTHQAKYSGAALPAAPSHGRDAAENKHADYKTFSNYLKR